MIPSVAVRRRRRVSVVAIWPAVPRPPGRAPRGSEACAFVNLARVFAVFEDLGERVARHSRSRAMPCAQGAASPRRASRLRGRGRPVVPGVVASVAGSGAASEPNTTPRWVRVRRWGWSGAAPIPGMGGWGWWGAVWAPSRWVPRRPGWCRCFRVPRTACFPAWRRCRGWACVRGADVGQGAHGELQAVGQVGAVAVAHC